ncbi:hypothetical protein AB0E81_26095 [Streptomyces sp. NPDC033538]|uniref:hypothetical protein n=1 Tax=Streptomyces sp. NPDC033538 TaxID=3155367 RepID=UPI0033E4EF96
MDTDLAPTPAPTGENSGCAIGCVVGVLFLVMLVVGGAWVLDELVKGLDGDGQLEQVGASGGVADPLGPGVVARYEDGLNVTVDPPHREPDGTYSFTVTYENGTDEKILPGGESSEDSVSEAGPAPLSVRAGEPLDNYSEYDLTWLNRQESAFLLILPLDGGETRSVPVRVKPSERGTPVTVEVAPPDDGYRDTAHFQFVLD